MHEMGIIASVLDSVRLSAQAANAQKVTCVRLRIGEMTQALPEALEFAFEALSEHDPLIGGATLEVEMIKPKSRCLECGFEFEHDRLHLFCPQCDSFATTLLAGRELSIDSIEVDIADEAALQTTSMAQKGRGAYEN